MKDKTTAREQLLIDAIEHLNNSIEILADLLDGQDASTADRNRFEESIVLHQKAERKVREFSDKINQ